MHMKGWNQLPPITIIAKLYHGVIYYWGHVSKIVKNLQFLWQRMTMSVGDSNIE